MKLYRAMKSASDSAPELGPSARTLGIRRGDRAPHCDILWQDDHDILPPGEGGMSVAPQDPAHLPRSRRPASLGGAGLDPVWEIDDSELGIHLSVRPDRPGHALIEPMQAMTVIAFEQALAATRANWKKC